MKQLIIILIMSVSVLSFGTEIEANEWLPIKYVSGEKYIKVESKEKYGVVRTFYCRAVFYRDGKYKLIAPWFTETIIFQSNITDLTFTIIGGIK